MDRRRLVLTASSAAAVSASAALGQGVEVEKAKTTKTALSEYVGALTIMHRHADWVLQEVSALRESGRSIVPPVKYEDGHDSWLDCVDELEDAGLHLRTGVLDDNERSFDLAQQALDRARGRLNEVDGEIPRRVGRST